MADRSVEVLTNPVDIPEGSKRLEYKVVFPVKDPTAIFYCELQASYDGGKSWRTEASQEITGATDPKETKRDPGRLFSHSVQHDGRACLTRMRLLGNKSLAVQVDKISEVGKR